MNTNDDKLLFKEGFFESSGVQSKSSIRWARGLVEKPYENALVVEFRFQAIPFQQQPSFGVLYKGYKVGLFLPDLIAFNTIAVDAKAIDRITDHERGLMLNYLRTTNLRAGVILNFKRSKLEWERIVL